MKYIYRDFYGTYVVGFYNRSGIFSSLFEYTDEEVAKNEVDSLNKSLGNGDIVLNNYGKIICTRDCVLSLFCANYILSTEKKFTPKLKIENDVRCLTYDSGDFEKDLTGEVWQDVKTGELKYEIRI